jgi:hypothetical protein
MLQPVVVEGSKRQTEEVEAKTICTRAAEDGYGTSRAEEQ